MKYLDGFRNPDAASRIAGQINEHAAILRRDGRRVAVMEVCGTHTMAIARYAIRDLLPPEIELISGPGCPVCVTDVGFIDAAIHLADRGAIVATFGDMVRVPGSAETLSDARARGGRVEVCYSPAGAVTLALANPEQQVVFLGIGFETTVAPIAAVVDTVVRRNIANLTFLTAFKLVPPALTALLDDPELKIDAFLCPAHVSAIIGANAYLPYAERYGVPCVVAGFEPLDILFGLQEIARQAAAGQSMVVNHYSRVVRPQGNVAAQRLIDQYLCSADVPWRGIGVIPGSGLTFRSAYREYDATVRHEIEIRQGNPDKGCRCGDVLKGKIKPPDCPLFGAVCTPLHPVGPCMVSSEGSCAAYYRYARPFRMGSR